MLSLLLYSLYAFLHDLIFGETLQGKPLTLLTKNFGGKISAKILAKIFSAEILHFPAEINSAEIFPAEIFLTKLAKADRMSCHRPFSTEIFSYESFGT